MASTLPGQKPLPEALEGLPFDNTYARLPARFYARVEPAPVAQPGLVRLNHELAASLGIDPGVLSSPEGVEMLAGNRPAAGADPLAMAYGGHQFGHWVPQLGDGRALLLGEVIDRSGIRRDIHMKGTGPTPFSRGGDGRSSIGPVVREYLASEAMAALGIPTTRALAAVSTGEAVMREGPVPGGILARVAASHVRVGTFEYFARRGDRDAVRSLADYVIGRNYPELVDSAEPHAAFYDAVIDRTAALVARWMGVGFIHGVMNTDNTSVVGETIDYGPFGFIDEFDPATVYSSIDRRGRYAWHSQPGIAHWNLARLGECLLPLLGGEQAEALERANRLLGSFEARFETRFHQVFAEKLGLAQWREGDELLITALLECMHDNRADMTLTFRRLSDLPGGDTSEDGPVRELFDAPEAFDAWARRWRDRLGQDERDDGERCAAMRSVNPAFILRNHLAQRAADAAIESLDFEPMHRLLEVLARPYEDQPDQAAEFARPPRPEERVVETFCGT